jgi:hypothetical protein
MPWNCATNQRLSVYLHKSKAKPGVPLSTVRILRGKSSRPVIIRFYWLPLPNFLLFISTVFISLGIHISLWDSVRNHFLLVMSGLCRMPQTVFTVPCTSQVWVATYHLFLPSLPALEFAPLCRGSEYNQIINSCFRKLLIKTPNQTTERYLFSWSLKLILPALNQFSHNQLHR